MSMIRLKQTFVRMALGFLKGLVWLRKAVHWVLTVLFGPIFRVFYRMGRFLLIRSNQVMYRFSRYATSDTDVQRGLVYIFSHRFAIHVVLLAVALMVGYQNVLAGDVREEGFGEQSLMFALVSDSFLPEVEEVVASETVVVERFQDEPYFGSQLLSAGRSIDFHSPDDRYVSTTTGGTVVSPLIQESRPSVAPRTDVESYVVQSGDTLGGIAEQFGLSVNTLLWSNGLTFRSVLKIGQELTIPPVDGVIHTVKSGDTLSGIARKYDADSDNIISFNRLAAADDLSIGEELIIPGGQVVASTPTRSIAPVRSIFRGTPTSTPASTPSPPTPSASGWVWPTDLRYITQYYGWRHTGIDVDCDGRAVSTNFNYAASDGVVTYSGWRNGYGYTVEINHANGIKTRYAHFQTLSVSNGQVVTAGTPLGRCGTTGRSTGTHLHFEVIIGGRFVNPLQYVR